VLVVQFKSFMLASIRVRPLTAVSPVVGSSVAFLIALLIAGAVIYLTPLTDRLQAVARAALIGSRFDYLGPLREGIKGIAAHLEPEELLEYVVETLHRSFGAERVSLYLRDERGQLALRRQLSEGDRSDAALSPDLLDWLGRQTGVIVRSEQRDQLSPAAFAPLARALDGAGAEVAVPLTLRNELEGALLLGPKRDLEAYCPDDLELLEAFASQTAIACKNAQLYDEAFVDGLTQVYRSKYFRVRLSEEIARCAREKNPLSLLLIDLDHFKDVNDQHGHLVGDTVLKSAAQLFRAQVRTSDVVARYGGDEFVVLLVNTPGQAAAALGTRLLTNAVQVELPAGIQIGFSIGVGTYLGAPVECHGDQLIEVADHSLYDAKNAGRGRVGPVNSVTIQ
jgi:diguanylate cyclase (GGDEF)-like protein